MARRMLHRRSVGGPKESEFTKLSESEATQSVPGGMIAQQIAQDRPSRFRGMIPA